jgi:hypothetical protein
MTMASCVLASPITEQLHCNGPTGKISWIILSFVDEGAVAKAGLVMILTANPVRQTMFRMCSGF